MAFLFFRYFLWQITISHFEPSTSCCSDKTLLVSFLAKTPKKLQNLKNPKKFKSEKTPKKFKSEKP
jgi:hypothetical protein